MSDKLAKALKVKPTPAQVAVADDVLIRAMSWPPALRLVLAQQLFGATLSQHDALAIDGFQPKAGTDEYGDDNAMYFVAFVTEADRCAHMAGEARDLLAEWGVKLATRPRPAGATKGGAS